MAGVVPTKRSTSGRKQWTLHDGPRSSLKCLRNQLANDGCAESQVVLAKQFLEQKCDIEEDKKENYQQGVYWLIKSSEQGNTEATELLSKCLSAGKGITEHNYMDVKACIDMTQDEKLARKAARDMFASLSNGEDFITSQQLQKRMLEIDKEENVFDEQVCEDFASSDSEEEMDWSQRQEGTNEKLTEDHVIAAAADYSHGQLPLLNKILCLNDPNLHALDHVPYIHRSILHPLLAIKILYYKLIKLLGASSFSSYFSYVRNDYQLLFLMFVYSFLSSNNVVYFLPLLLYYATFCVMTVTTFQMLQMKRNYQDFRVWSSLFITYSGGSVNAAEAEYQFVRNNMKPYVHFFVAVLLNFLVYPVVSNQWIPQSEMTVLAFCLTFMTLHSFMVKERSQNFPDLLVLLSFAVNVLAKYPYETDTVVTQSWRFLDVKVPGFASYIVGNGIEFCINFRAFFYIFIPVLFMYIAAKQNWRGTYKFLIPHCVTLSWLQIVIIYSQGTTMFGLIRGTLALVGVVLFLPLAGLTTIILPAIALTKWVMTTISVYSLCVFFFFASTGLGISWLFARTRFSQYVAFLQVIIGLLTFYILVNSFSVNNSTSYLDNTEVKTFTWDQYQNLCHQPSWETDNMAVTQMRCLKLIDSQVEWEGYINDITIKSVNNVWKNIFDRLPRTLNQYLYCLWGDPIQHDCSNVPDLIENDCMVFYDTVKNTKRCSLDKFNQYQFEIVVRMHSGLWGKTAEVILDVSDHFKNFSLQLRPNDKIKFKGLLKNHQEARGNGILGGLNPHITLEHIQCVACHNSKLTERKLLPEKLINPSKILSNFYIGIKFILNILFEPIVVFK